MRLLIGCAFSLALFCGSVRAQSMSISEAMSRQRQAAYEAIAERNEELAKTPEGRAILATEAKARQAKANAADPVFQARLRAYQKNHRAAIAAKRNPAPSAPVKPLAREGSAGFIGPPRPPGYVRGAKP